MKQRVYDRQLAAPSTKREVSFVIFCLEGSERAALERWRAQARYDEGTVHRRERFNRETL
jgi:hypothetical protein